MLIRKGILVLGLVILASVSAFAQSSVMTSPSRVSSVNVSSTIAVTNTFQSIIASNIGANRVRQGCLIQNKSTSAVLWVYFGAIAGATAAKAFALAPDTTNGAGGAISCVTSGGGVLQDQVSVTGTSGEAFTAAYQ